MSRRPTSAGTASLPPQQVRRLVRPSGQVPHHHPSSPARCTYGRGVSLSLARAPSRVNLINPRDRAPTALRPCGVRVSSWRGDAAGGGGQVRGADGRKNPGGGGGGNACCVSDRAARRVTSLSPSRGNVSNQTHPGEGEGHAMIESAKRQRIPRGMSTWSRNFFALFLPANGVVLYYYYCAAGEASIC